MFRNYLKIALRNLLKSKMYTLLNITGLAVGLTCFLLIMLYVRYERSYDRFHDNSDRIYRVAIHLPTWNFRGKTDFAKASAILAPTLMDTYSDVQKATRLKDLEGLVATEKGHFIHRGIMTDVHFLDVFTFPLIEGDRQTALMEPLSMIITENLAGKLFGDEEPIGRRVRFRNALDFKVTGVIEDVPGNSHIDFDYILSMASAPALGRSNLDQWGLIDYCTYILLEPGVSPIDIEIKLPDFVEKHHTFRSEETKPAYFLQPLHDIHLRSHLNFELSDNGDLRVIRIFTMIAMMILMIACMNYINLATARSEIRRKEIGIRKTIGAVRMQLIGQFLGESSLIVVLAMWLALAVATLLFPEYCRVLNMDHEAGLLAMRNLSIWLPAIFLIVGFFSGLYPAFVLSSLHPVRALKKSARMSGGRRNLFVRNGFVLVQFIITMLLILSAAAVQRQVHYIRTHHPGYAKENIVIVDCPKENRHQYLAIKETLLQNPKVIGVAFSNTNPLRYSEANPARIEIDPEKEMIQLPQVGCFYVDYDFLETYDIRILKGRGFSRDFATDGSNAVIINETTASSINLANPIGKRFSRSDVKEGSIIGVVQDFHQVSFKQKIEPVMFLLRPERASQFSIKIIPDDVHDTLDYIHDTFRQYSEHFVFDYEFFDDAFNHTYRAEMHYGVMLFAFSSIAICLATLGLVGLISYITERSKKAIGIRKTLGASVSNLVYHLNRDFLILIVISIHIAIPIGYILMKTWLETFAYRANLHPLIFVFSSLFMLFFTMLTVGIQSMKAALADPIETLRCES